ncbi:MAG: hypothetical protein ACRC1K_15165, partial [Planctomycetia bacterium]
RRRLRLVRKRRSMIMPRRRGRRAVGRRGAGVSVVEANEEPLAAVLRPLLCEPEGRPVFTSGKIRGLFATESATARRTLEQLSLAGLIAVEADAVGPGEKSSKPRARLTERGRTWLVDRQNPTVLLEDLLRTAEAQQGRLDQIEQLCRQQHDLLDALRQNIGAVLDVWSRTQRNGGPATREPFVVDPPTEEAEEVDAAALAWLRRRARGDHPADGTLAELYHALAASRPTLTIGRFHDAVRRLHAAGRLRLGPWTGPLYQLPEPALALLVGCEVLYYVHVHGNPAS